MIFVTGGTGMLGSYLLLELAKQNNRIRALRRKNSSLAVTKKIFDAFSDDSENLFSKIEWIEGDLSDPETFKYEIADCQEIYNCAAMVSFRKSDRSLLMETNVSGTANLVNVLLENNNARLCHVSSIASLGSTNDGQLITEKTQWAGNENNSSYSVSKYYSEIEVWRGIAEGLNAVIVNPSVILGAGNWNNGSPAIFKLIDNGLKYYTNGITGFVYAQDVAKCMIKLMKSPVKSERFIISSENLGWKELFENIARSLHKKSPEKYASPLMTEIAWRALHVAGIFTGKPATFTKNTARTSHKILNYSNAHFKNNFDFGFTPIATAIKLISGVYILDNTQNRH